MNRKAFASLALVALAVGAAQVEPPPGPRERLAGTDYAERYNELAASPKPDDSEPPDGVFIMAVDDGSPAVDLGLKGGEVICGVDGRPIHGQQQFDRTRAAARGDQTLSVWSPIALARRDVVVHPGRIGFTSDDNASPDVAYVRGLPKGIDPSVELLVALRAAANDPELAETALFHAREQGIAGQAFAGSSAIVAYHDARYDDAAAWATQWSTVAGHDVDPAWRMMIDRVAYRSAMATGRFADALRVRTANPDALAKADSVRADSLIPAARATSRPVGDIDLATLPGLTDHRADLANADDGDDDLRRKGSEYAVREVRQGRPVRFNVGSSNFYRYAFGPSGNNAEFSVRCDCHATQLDAVVGAYLILELTTQPGSYADPLIAVQIYPGNGTVFVLPANLPQCITDQSPRVSCRKPFDVTVTLVGDRCRVSVGGRVAFDGVIPGIADASSRHLSATALASGLTGTLDRVRWRTAAAK